MSHLPDLSRGAVVEQLAARLARLDLPARVAIDGADAAGKTTLADELATLLGATVTRIGADAGRFASSSRSARKSPSDGAS